LSSTTRHPGCPPSNSDCPNRINIKYHL
jgi:hypothetical protein